MKSKKNLIAIAVLILLITFLCLTGCSKSASDTDKDDLKKFDTQYTRCEANDDGTYSLYIYAAPVQFKKDGQYYKKDNSIVESSDSKDAFENKENDIKTIFSKVLDNGLSIVDEQGKVNINLGDCKDFENGKLINYTNIFGDTVEAVLYEDKDSGRQIVVYPTISGIYVELQCQNNTYIPKITVRTDTNAYEKKKNGYIVLKSGDEKKVVIYEPVIKYEDNNELHFDMKYSCHQREGGLELQFPTDAAKNQKSVRIAFSIERYVKKMPDTSLYSKANINSYLRNYAVIGKHDLFGEGIEYLRFRANYYMNTRSDNIISAEYCMKRLDYKRSVQTLTLYKKKTQWSSTRDLWNDNMERGSKIVGESTSDGNGWLHFDITQFMKQCVSDRTWLMESYGCILEGGSGYAIVATSDNSLYVPYIKVTMKNKLKYFKKHENGEEDTGPNYRYF